MPSQRQPEANVSQLRQETTSIDVVAIRDQLVSRVDADHKYLPQYRGHWSNWLLGRIVEDTTSEPRFARDELVLVEPTRRALQDVGYVTVYSNRLGANTHIPAHQVVILRG